MVGIGERTSGRGGEDIHALLPNQNDQPSLRKLKFRHIYFDNEIREIGPVAII
jgi:hypothetical protein